MSDTTLKVGGDVSGATRAFEELKKSITTVAEAGESIGKTLNKAVAFTALKEGFDIGREAIAGFIEEYKGAEEASNDLNSSMRSQKVYTSELREEYDKIAESLAAKTKFDDDDVRRGEAKLQTYLGQTKITEELAARVADLAAREKIDLVQASDLVGQALQGQRNGLAKYGIGIDQSASKTERLKEVLDGLTAKFYGAAEAQTEGLGAIDQAHKAYDDLAKVIGQQLAPFVETVANGLRAVFEVLKEHPIIATAGAAFLVLGTAFAGITAAAIGLSIAWPAIAAGFAAVAPALLGFAAPAAIVVGVIAALGAAAYGLYKAWTTNFGGIQEKTAGTFAAIAAMAKTLWDNVGPIFKGLGKALLGIMSGDVGLIKEGYADLKKAAVDTIDATSKAYAAAHDKRIAEITAEKKAEEDRLEFAAGHRTKGGGESGTTRTQAEIDDAKKAAEIRAQIRLQELQDQLAHIDRVDLKNARSDAEVEKALERQMALALELYHRELEGIDKTKGATAEAAALKEQAAVKFGKVVSDIADKAAQKEKEMADRLAEFREKNAVESLDSQISRLDKLDLEGKRFSDTQLKTYKQVDEALAAQLELAKNRRDVELDYIEKNKKGTQEEGELREKAEIDYQKLRGDLEEKAAEKRDQVRKQDEAKAIELVKATAQDGLKGIAGVAATAIGTAFGGPIGGEIAGQLFNALSKNKEEFKAYFKGLFDPTFIENIFANLGYAAGKIFLSPGFSRSVAIGVATGVRDGVKEGAQNIGDVFHDLFDGSGFNVDGGKMEKLRAQLEKVNAELVDLMKARDELIKKVALDTLQETVDEQQKILDAATSAKKDAEKELEDAVKQQRDQTNKALLDQLNERLQKENDAYSTAKDKRVQLERDLQSLLDQQADKKNAAALKAAEDDTKDQKSLLDRAAGERDRLHQDILSTQDDIQHSHDDAEKQALQDHLAEVKAQYDEWNARYLEALSTFQQADASAKASHQVEQEKSLEEQIAETKAKLDQARADELAAQQSAADAKSAVTAQQAVDEVVITQAKINELKSKLAAAAVDEIVARQKLAIANKAFTDAEVTDRERLLAIEEQITADLERQKQLKAQTAPENVENSYKKPQTGDKPFFDPVASGKKAGDWVNNTFGGGGDDDSGGILGSGFGLTGFDAVMSGIKQAVGAARPGGAADFSGGYGAKTPGFGSYTGLDAFSASSLPKQFNPLDYDYNPQGYFEYKGASGQQPTIGSTSAYKAPVGSSSGSKDRAVVIRLDAGSDEFSQLISRMLTRGTALGTGGVRVVNGSED